MTPIIFNSEPTPNGVGTRAIMQDMKSPIRGTVTPVPDSYHVFVLPQVFAWCTLSVAPQGSATIYFTISSPESVRSGSAVWHKWDQDAVTAPAWHSWEHPWMALRVDCDAPTRIEIAAKYG